MCLAKMGDWCDGIISRKIIHDAQSYSHVEIIILSSQLLRIPLFLGIITSSYYFKVNYYETNAQTSREYINCRGCINKMSCTGVSRVAWCASLPLSIFDYSWQNVFAHWYLRIVSHSPTSTASTAHVAAVFRPSWLPREILQPLPARGLTLSSFFILFNQKADATGFPIA